MYGNLEPSLGGQEQMWALAPGGEACSDPSEENPYEPLDPLTVPPSQKQVAEPPGKRWPRPRPPQAAVVAPKPLPVPGGASWACPSREQLLLGAAVALVLSVLLNVVCISLGLRNIAALTEELEAEKSKEPPNMASRSFLIYNQHQQKCVVAKGQLLTATTCQPQAPAQHFQWLLGGRLRSGAGGGCVTAAQGHNLSVVRLEACREDGRLQRWQCGAGGLLALQGSQPQLYFNYGNHPKQTVMLYSGDRQWSRWVVHGTAQDVCSCSCCPPCSKGWIHFRNSCYFYSKTSSSWDTAQRFCSELGSQLLEVDDPEERDHVRKILGSSSWLGIRDEEVEGTWKRANGSILEWKSSSWHRDEPNGGRQENCAVLGKDGQWYDYPCSTQLPWVCEGHP